MTVLDHMKAAGYDPNAAHNADDLRRMGAGTMECESIQLRTFRCRPYQYEGEMLAVEATAMVPFTDGTQRPYPDGWPSSIKASAMAFFRIKEDERGPDYCHLLHGWLPSSGQPGGAVDGSAHPRWRVCGAGCWASAGSAAHARQTGRHPAWA